MLLWKPVGLGCFRKMSGDKIEELPRIRLHARLLYFELENLRAVSEV